VPTHRSTASDSDLKFWPYKPRLTLAATASALVGLLLAVAILRAFAKWPSEHSETVVLIGVLLLSLLPIALAVLDVIIDRGGTIEYGKVKIDFRGARKRRLPALRSRQILGSKDNRSPTARPRKSSIR